ncbi:MAG TPA: PIG-L family deacetylase [Acidimicrobiales bacterium]|nr:PIG-L family deacetylase [Acidimicrobiales bacterium]
MATLVAFHAHPDDECLLQSGTLAMAVDAGHRVVVVYATGGELGQAPDGLLAPGERLVDRRRREAEESAAATGAQRIVWLCYHDSGMDGSPENDDPACFWRADVEEAARRLADVLAAERADVVTYYDPNGNYGHPDHVQVHRVGARAAELAGTPRALEVTWSRENAMKLMAEARRNGIGGFDAESTDVDLNLEDPNVTFGTREAEITTRVDVARWLDRKRAAIAAHASQVGDTGPFLAMPPDMFARALSTEFYVRRDLPPGTRDDDIFAGLA